MTDNLIESTNKLSSLIKMTRWHAHVVHMVKNMNMVGVAVWWGALGSGPLGPPKSGAGCCLQIKAKMPSRIPAPIKLHIPDYVVGPR